MPAECAYCGDLTATTVDHIPPRTVYRKPRPSTMPSVKACLECHGKRESADDEYFRDTVLNYYRVSDLPQAQEQLAAMFRGVSKPEKRKYLDAIIRRLGRAEVRTTAGLYLGHAQTYTMDVPRLERTARRYVRGLYRYQLGNRLPEDWTVLTMVKPDHIYESATVVGPMFNAQPRSVVQAGVFWYSWRILGDGGGVWLLVFFDAYPVMGVVYPPGKAPADVAARAAASGPSRSGPILLAGA